MIWPQCCVLEISHLPPPRGIYPQKMLLLAKMFLLSLYFENHVSDFMIFAQMLEIIALSDLASVLCARKFSFASQGGFTPQNTPFLAKMVLLSLYLQNRASDFDDFCTDVRDSCPV